MRVLVFWLVCVWRGEGQKGMGKCSYLRRVVVGRRGKREAVCVVGKYGKKWEGGGKT